MSQYMREQPILTEHLARELFRLLSDDNTGIIPLERVNAAKEHVFMQAIHSHALWIS